jgi:hypothetical protein
MPSFNSRLVNHQNPRLPTILSNRPSLPILQTTEFFFSPHRTTSTCADLRRRHPRTHVIATLGREPAPDRARGPNAESGNSARAPSGPFPILPSCCDASRTPPATAAPSHRQPVAKQPLGAWPWPSYPRLDVLELLNPRARPLGQGIKHLGFSPISSSVRCREGKRGNGGRRREKRSPRVRRHRAALPESRNQKPEQLVNWRRLSATKLYRSREAIASPWSPPMPLHRRDLHCYVFISAHRKPLRIRPPASRRAGRRAVRRA